MIEATALRRRVRAGKIPQTAGQTRISVLTTARAAIDSARVRADASRMLGEARADASREREDLRARAERAERQADAYRDELAQLRAAGPELGATEFAAEPPAKAPRLGTRGQATQPRQAADQ